MALDLPGFGAQDEESVRFIYEDVKVAETYIRRRFEHAWGQLLHRKQVLEVNRVIQEAQPDSILEVAAGPARITAELKGVHSGLMVDNSEAMLRLAQHRLQAAGLSHSWKLEKGNAFELQRLGRQFQFVFTFRFLRHFRSEDRARLCAAFAACLSPTGFLMFDVVNRAVRDQVDARETNKAQDQLNVYDQTYSVKSFRREMTAYGFQVIRLTPVVNHFFIQSWITNRVGGRLPGLSRRLVFALERISSQEPLEWIALCRKSG